MPKGVQQHRGQALPPNTKSVARPSRWGNLFRVGMEGFAAAEAKEAYRRYLAREEPYQRWPVKPPPTTEEIRANLAGYDLACYCPLEDENGEPHPCHRDVLLEIANGTD